VISVINPTTTQTTLLNTANSVTSTATPKKTITLLTKQLIKGSQNAEVKILQTYLSTDKTLYPEASVTGLFGPATERAVQRFQVKYGLAKKGVVGYGQVGPKTRAKFNELLLK
jgi:peptidoglycan hydrolase-like protein with peptidoglycan-binding domain